MAKLKRRKRKRSLSQENQTESIDDLLKLNKDGIRCGYCEHFRHAPRIKREKSFFRTCVFYRPEESGLKRRQKKKEVLSGTVAFCSSFVPAQSFWCDQADHWQYLKVCLLRHQRGDKTPVNCSHCRQFEREVNLILPKAGIDPDVFQYHSLKRRKNNSPAAGFYEDEGPIVFVEKKRKPERKLKRRKTGRKLKRRKPKAKSQPRLKRRRKI